MHRSRATGLICSKRTLLQEAFCRNKGIQDLYIDIIADLTGIPTTGYRRLYRSLARGMLHDVPDAEIKELLYIGLRCFDVSAGQKAEMLAMLRLSETAMTDKQRRKLKRILNRYEAD